MPVAQEIPELMDVGTLYGHPGESGEFLTASAIAPGTIDPIGRWGLANPRNFSFILIVGAATGAEPALTDFLCPPEASATEEIRGASGVKDEATQEFVRLKGLDTSVRWACSNLPMYFDSTDFEVELLPADEDGFSQLAFTIQTQAPNETFREHKRGFYRAMRQAGHLGLYEIACILRG